MGQSGTDGGLEAHPGAQGDTDASDQELHLGNHWLSPFLQLPTTLYNPQTGTVWVGEVGCAGFLSKTVD